MELICAENTLVYDPELCVGCGLCSEVCPHGVFSAPEPISADSRLVQARLLHAEDCMECGACALNCLTGAIRVQSGVGCAAAMIMAALTGREISCGGPTCGCSTSQASSGCCDTPIAQAAANCCGDTSAVTPSSKKNKVSCC
ncbi:MAG: 4Fe-4S binding protein [Anaerolineae bacterium]